MLIHGAMLLMPGEKRSQVKKLQNNSVKKVDKISYTPYKFLAPTIAAMLLLMGYPLVNNVWLAFQRKNLLTPNKTGFYGFGNFAAIFADKDIPMIAWHTLIFVVCTVGLQFFLGFGLAMALRKPFRGRKVYQSIVFVPWAFSGMIVGLIFKWLFNGEFGAVNDILLKLNLISQKISFLGSSSLALMVVILALVWVGVPFFAIMILAALQSIPSSLYEAADIDGAGSFTKFFSITLPFIKPTIIMTLLLRTIWVFNNADMIYVITQGGPGNSTHTLSSYLYAKSLSSLDFGYTAALGLIFMIGLAIYASIVIRVTNYEEAGDF